LLKQLNQLGSFLQP